MGGTDAVVTDDAVADLILEYAMELGRTGRTDTITIPVSLQGESVEASMLLGPASQITLTPDLDSRSRPIELEHVVETRAVLRDRIDQLTGRIAGTERAQDAQSEFVDFDEYEGDGFTR